MEFGREYIIPKPFDPRVLIWEAAAVAQAAMETGVAQQPVDLDEYKEQLERRLGKAREVMRIMIHKAQRRPKRVVFPEGEETKILRACQILLDEKIASPILLGDEAVDPGNASPSCHLHLDGVTDRRSAHFPQPGPLLGRALPPAPAQGRYPERSARDRCSTATSSAR